MKTPIHSSIGQEAVAVGVCHQLGQEDLIFTNHRSHAHYLAKGGELKAMIAELYNRETGCARGRGGSMHLVDPAAGIPGSSAIVGGGIALATGAALAFSIRGESSVTVTFFGDGASEEGLLYESINFAALKNLPVIYICENNQYAVCSPLANRQKPIPIYKRFQGFDIPCRQIDGNSIEDVYRAAGEAVLHARNGLGPSLLECITYRLRDHHGIKTGVAAGYQSREEWETWEEKCPLKRIEWVLEKRGLLASARKADLVTQLQFEITEAFNFARNSPFPVSTSLSEGLFS